MLDVDNPPESAGSLLPRKDELLNGYGSAEHTPSRSLSALESRETSLPTKAVDQLHIVSTPSDDEEEEESDDEEFLKDLPNRPALRYQTLPTGLCYDPRMRFHAEYDPSRDRSDYHPEDPRRIVWIYRTLCEAGLVNDESKNIKPLVPIPLRRIAARHATREEITCIHSPSHFDFLKTTASKWS